MTYRLSMRSRDRLKGVHPVLVGVVERAIQITEVDFAVTEGVRSLMRQSELFEARATRTMNSKHLTGHAVDLAPMIGGEVRWDWPCFYPMADAMKAAAAEQGVEITWGGDWTTFKDGPHFEIDPKKYPWPMTA